MYSLIMEKIESHFDSLIEEAKELCMATIMPNKNLPWVMENSEENGEENGDSLIQKVQNVKAKLKSSFQKVSDTLNSALMKKIEKLGKSKEHRAEKCKLKGKEPNVVYEWISDKYKKIFETIHKYLYEFRRFKKFSVPVATIIRYMPPLTFVIGSTEAILSVESIVDFLLDYRRLQKNQLTAVDEFIEEIEEYMNSDGNAKESTSKYKPIRVLANFFNKVSNVLGKIVSRAMLELKRLIGGVSSVLFKSGKAVIKYKDENALKQVEVKHKIANDKMKEMRAVKKEQSKKRKEEKLKAKQKFSKSDNGNIPIEKKLATESSYFALADMDLFDIGDGDYELG